MRFSVQLPTDQVSRGEEFLTGSAIASMARAVESAGFAACFVTEHPFPGDRWLAAGGHHALDPFVALSFAAAATQTLRLQTNILVLAYRNPFLAAKSIASLDVLSGGRVILGVAAGYLRAEFGALGVDVEERAALLDESLVAMKAAWTRDGVTLKGRHFEAHGNTMRPRPLQQPHPPIWMGGNSRAAIRRAVEHAQGWIPFPTQPGAAASLRTARLEDMDDLRARLAYLREVEAEAGRDPLDVCFMPFGVDMFSTPDLEAGPLLDEVAELREAGVTWVPVWMPASTRAEYEERIEQFGEEVIARLTEG